MKWRMFGLLAAGLLADGTAMTRASTNIEGPQRLGRLGNGVSQRTLGRPATLVGRTV